MENISEVLNGLNSYIKSKNVEGKISFQKEDARLVRCGRNQISVNTKQIGGSLIITIQDKKKTINREFSGLTFDLTPLQKEIDEMVMAIQHLPEKPYLKQIIQKEVTYEKHNFLDQEIEKDRSLDMVHCFKKVSDHFNNINTDSRNEVSGAFSIGHYGYLYIDSTMEDSVYHESSDFHVEVVVQLVDDHKKEIRTSQTGESWSQYDLEKIINDLDQLYKIKKKTKRQDLSPGNYDVIFCNDAFAELITYMSYITFYGESSLFKNSMISSYENPIGEQLFSKKLNIIDDPHDEDIIFKRLITPTGIKRNSFPLIENGILKNLIYSDKETCDMFDKNVNNHFGSANLKVTKGNGPTTLDEVISSTEKPTILISFIHYLNFTNTTKGEFTGTSRFGTFLIENKEVKSHLYNLRINDNFFNIFKNIDWLSQDLGHCSVSSSYGLRWPFAVTSPKFVKINNVNITATSNT